MTEHDDDLPALDPSAAALLAAHRRGQAMPPAVRARVHDRIVQTCAEEHVLPFRSDGARAWAVALALAAAAVLWFARRENDLSEQTGDTAVMSPAYGAAATEPGDARAARAPAAEPLLDPRDSSPTTTEAEAAPAPETVVGPAERRAPLSRKQAASGRRATIGDGRGEPPASDLRGEQELLARGWQALAAGRADVAADDAAEHARSFPAAILGPERRALAAAAACVNDPAHGADLARAFLADHPRSPLARRVRDSCELAP